MNISIPDLFEAALTLPDSERADLAYQLLSSLPPPGILSEDDPGFAAELERRIQNYESGKTSALEIDEVTESIRSAIRNRRSS